MPDTGGRGPGEDGQNPKGAVEAAAARDQVEPSLWRAVCRESGLHGSGRGGWKRAVFTKPPEGFLAGLKNEQHLAGRLLHELRQSLGMKRL